MQVAHLDAVVQQVIREVLGHALGQGGHEDALVLGGAGADLVDQVVDLALRGFDGDLRVHQASRANHLLHKLALGGLELVVAGGGGHVHGLPHAGFELVEGQRAVVHCGRQAETEFHQVALSRHVAFEHAADLGHGDVGLIDDGEEVFREVVDQRRRRGPRRTAVHVPRVVLDAGTEPDLLDHLQVVLGAHAQALRLEQLALVLQLLEPVRELFLNGLDSLFHALVRGHVVGGREDAHLVFLADHVAGERVDVVQRVHLVAEELHTHGHLFVGRDDVHGVALDAEGAALEVDVVALVLHVHQKAQETVALHFLAHAQHNRSVQVGLRGAQAVDAGHRRHHDHVAAAQKRGGGGVAQALHVVVDGRVLLNVGVGLRDVGLRLVVVVVRHEVLHRVVGQQLAQLVGQLRGQRLVRRHDQRGTLLLLNQPRGGGGLTGAGRAHEHDVALAAVQTLVQLRNRRWLVAGGFELGDDLEGFLASLNLAHGAKLRLREDGMFSSKSHSGQCIAKSVGEALLVDKQCRER